MRLIPCYSHRHQKDPLVNCPTTVHPLVLLAAPKLGDIDFCIAYGHCTQTVAIGFRKLQYEVRVGTVYGLDLNVSVSLDGLAVAMKKGGLRHTTRATMWDLSQGFPGTDAPVSLYWFMWHLCVRESLVRVRQCSRWGRRSVRTLSTVYSTCDSCTTHVRHMRDSCVARE